MATQNNKIILIIHWLLVLIFMAAIFGFSSEDRDKSGNRSAAIAQAVKKVIEPIEKLYPDRTALTVGQIDHLVRKTAHITEYMILSMLLLLALKRSGVKSKRSFLLAFLITAVYAASDEFHQVFVPGRGPLLSDVFIDSTGAGLFLLLSYLILRVKNLKRANC